ncbi:MAG: uroporphyrinogen decarboxylase family protein [Candidatus Accumulibacter meliphilus]|jgi:uroporphyrinogen-III decarboxylase|uniref:uroporphyrinogen decarboxylase family protein n=1 Tax=Candidatus Accumulibacter meliphilus TaxID=2211374 RepID=UPI002FC30F48
MAPWPWLSQSGSARSPDWSIDIGEARRRVGHKLALQGKIDLNGPFASPDKIGGEAQKILDGYGSGNTGPVVNRQPTTAGTAFHNFPRLYV